MAMIASADYYHFRFRNRRVSGSLNLKGRFHGFFFIFGLKSFALPVIMEATEGDQLKMIRPPSLEEAGLEDCALPPEAIKEAFAKAASSVKSRAASLFSAGEEKEPGDCVQNPAPTVGELKDSLIGMSARPGKSCGAAEKGRLTEVWGDKVVPGVESGGSSDKVLGAEVPAERGGRACVDGLRGVRKVDEGGYETDDEGEREKPILAEGFV
ncbi:hypothetical protein H6P81_000590 [Aristolochia fimbriata]|uniref:Uncharacterized protein n=1 Tax=Aristolochia fimbriata TaxID=158543 RepID=A0AAV7F4Q8_ARIFI|nr:hypothetical protein H6P81_000590 [Aristolochia fimbriata]